VPGVSPANPTIAAGTAASTVPIRDIPEIRGHSNFPRNSQPNFAQYISEQLEMNSRGENSKKAKTTNKRKKQNTGDLHLFRKHP
jgi:hypothetical protein